MAMRARLVIGAAAVLAIAGPMLWQGLRTNAPLLPIAPLPAAAAATAEPPPAPLPERLGELIDAYVSAFGRTRGEASAFNGYVMVARDAKPVFAKGYGLANRETRVIADADTRFRIGSITKQFTAVAVLQLAERGKLRLDDALSRYVPGLPFGDHVALYHLLTQTSGVASYTDVEALMKEDDKPHTQAQVLAAFAETPLEFEPGTRFQYSNSNYFLLGMVIEKTTGGSYEDYLQRNVLGPAGMTRTSTIDAPDAPNTAVGYTVRDGAIVLAGPVDMSMPFAAGALRSTPGDLVRWDRALAGDALLGEASRRRMLSPMHDGYAYGVGVKTVAGRQVVEHGGGINGFTSQLSRVPSEGLVVAVLSNVVSDAPGQIAEAILKMALEGSQVPAVEWTQRGT
jgi:CubicO group peptidase (beta-lactamase class C family)